MSDVEEKPRDDEALEAPPQTPYDMLGGEAGVRRLVDRFYEVMDEAPEAAEIRAMHKDDLGPVRESLFEFLSGWLGGPPLYVQRTGTVCLAKPHRPYPIGEAERDQWMFCMRQALADTVESEKLRDLLDKPFFMVADFVRNR